MKRSIISRASPKPRGRSKLATGRARVTRKARKLTAAEIHVHEQRLRAEGRL